jgi:hypothetical protein
MKSRGRHTPVNVGGGNVVVGSTSNVNSGTSAGPDKSGDDNSMNNGKSDENNAMLI